ncbi:hypothetical protein MACH15_17220 [Maricaulis maris]|nr:hypothetical protein MACH15_17220 [Maricaulis maris]
MTAKRASGGPSLPDPQYCPQPHHFTSRPSAEVPRIVSPPRPWDDGEAEERTGHKASPIFRPPPHPHICMTALLSHDWPFASDLCYSRVRIPASRPIGALTGTTMEPGH